LTLSEASAYRYEVAPGVDRCRMSTKSQNLGRAWVGGASRKAALHLGRRTWASLKWPS